MVGGCHSAPVEAFRSEDHAIFFNLSHVTGWLFSWKAFKIPDEATRDRSFSLSLVLAD